MDNIRYLNGKQVQLLRTFVLGGVNYSEVMPSGEEESLVVVTSELNDNVQEKKSRKSKIIKVLCMTMFLILRSARSRRLST